MLHTLSSNINNEQRWESHPSQVWVPLLKTPTRIPVMCAHAQETYGHQHEGVSAATGHNSGQYTQEPVAGVETYAQVRKNLLLSRCMLRQLRDWKIQADK